MNELPNSLDSTDASHTIGKRLSSEDPEPLIAPSKILKIEELEANNIKLEPNPEIENLGNITTQTSDNFIKTEENDIISEYNNNFLDQNSLGIRSSNNSPRNSMILPLTMSLHSINWPKFKQKRNNIYYKKLKYKQEIYSVGDDILIKKSDSSNMVGRIIKIMEQADNLETQNSPMVEIKWFYSKEDIVKKNFPNEKYYECLGENELFTSDHIQSLSVDTINGKCRVMNEKEYDRAKNLESDTNFYCRANYNIHTRRLEPLIQTWSKSCSCKMPNNPEQIYIKCDICREWFHPQCQGITTTRKRFLKTIRSFHCKKCRKSQGKR